MDENIADIVLLKTDGIPTYHFAHAVDDTLMGTTHVVRSDEWVFLCPLTFSSSMCWDLKAAQVRPCLPCDERGQWSQAEAEQAERPGSRRFYFVDEGYPKEAVLEYCSTWPIPPLRIGDGRTRPHLTRITSSS